ncbi:hypothetical protein P154DRAFT_534488 [Amniculicola lignicola CBS 123094]|uniref:Uncharacterized protein n=1 Tax=Amniculicola lignicola CBS 123094 TaxID=1392246 RepID=A0A6A5WNS4_9PLEO|nr:hypothetical protein P154DRAFT_534488 [Amniculicola lignicola CBS 123094]
MSYPPGSEKSERHGCERLQRRPNNQRIEHSRNTGHRPTHHEHSHKRFHTTSHTIPRLPSITCSTHYKDKGSPKQHLHQQPHPNPEQRRRSRPNQIADQRDELQPEPESNRGGQEIRYSTNTDKSSDRRPKAPNKHRPNPTT